MKTPNYDQLLPHHKKIINSLSIDILANIESEGRSSLVISESLAEAFIQGAQINEPKTPAQKLDEAMQSIKDFANDPLKIAALQGFIDEFFSKIDFNALNVGRGQYEERQLTVEEIEQNKQQDLEFRRGDYERDLKHLVMDLIKAGKYSGKNQIIEEAATILDYIKQKSLQVVV